MKQEGNFSEKISEEHKAGILAKLTAPLLHSLWVK